MANKSILTLDEYKKILNVTDDSKDDAINYLIPAAASFARNYTRNDFTEGFPDDLKTFALKYVEFFLNSSANVSSEKDASESVTYVTELPAYIISLLNHYRKVKFC